MFTIISLILLICLGLLWFKEYKDGEFLEFAVTQQLKGYVVNVLDMSKLGKTEAEIEASYIEIDAAKWVLERDGGRLTIFL